MRKTIARSALGLSLLVGVSCNNDLCKLFNSDCKPASVSDSWVDEREHDVIVLSLAKNSQGVSVRGIESNETLFVNEEESKGNYSLRAYNFNGEIVFYRNFDLSNAETKLLIPRRIDLKEIRIYDCFCSEIINENVERLAIKY